MESPRGLPQLLHLFHLLGEQALNSQLLPLLHRHLPLPFPHLNINHLLRSPKSSNLSHPNQLGHLHRQSLHHNYPPCQIGHHHLRLRDWPPYPHSRFPLVSEPPIRPPLRPLAGHHKPILSHLSPHKLRLVSSLQSQRVPFSCLFTANGS